LLKTNRLPPKKKCDKIFPLSSYILHLTSFAHIELDKQMAIKKIILIGDPLLRKKCANLITLTRRS
jgi:hypothetical protein